jgi:hypothetical protein
MKFEKRKEILTHVISKFDLIIKQHYKTKTSLEVHISEDESYFSILFDQYSICFNYNNIYDATTTFELNKIIYTDKKYKKYNVKPLINIEFLVDYNNIDEIVDTCCQNIIIQSNILKNREEI